MHYYTDVLKKYAVFSGRARRREYWMFYLWNVIFSMVLVAAAISMAVAIKNPLPVLLPVAYGLAVLVPTLALAVRRLHDIGYSGAWFLIALVPVVGGILLLIFTLIDSKPGDNQYGPNPKGVGAVAGKS